MMLSTSVKLVFPSQVPLIDLVHAACERMAVLAGLTEDGALDLGLAVREAVINAMTHGNRLDPGKNVEVEIAAEDGSVSVRVQDHGAGFDPSITPDPRVQENRLKTSGRGILMMRSFVDSAEFRRRQGNGMEVTLRKRVAKDA